MRLRSGGTTPAYRQCPEETVQRSTLAFRRPARARCGLQSLWRIDSPFLLGRVVIPRGSSMTSRYLLGAYRVCTDAVYGFGCRCARVVLLRPYLRNLPGKRNCDSRFTAFDQACRIELLLSLKPS